jgi:hypothetical protein
MMTLVDSKLNVLAISRMTMSIPAFSIATLPVAMAQAIYPVRSPFFWI